MSKIITSEIRVNYLQLPDRDGNYSCQIIIHEDDVEQLAAIQAAIETVKSQEFPNKDILSTPLKHSSTKSNPLEQELNSFYLNTSSKYPITVTDKDKNVLTYPDIYSGMYARAIIEFYPWTYKGKSGIGAGLRALQKTRDGEKLFERKLLQDTFDEIETIAILD